MGTQHIAERSPEGFAADIKNRSPGRGASEEGPCPFQILFGHGCPVTARNLMEGGVRWQAKVKTELALRIQQDDLPLRPGPDVFSLLPERGRKMLQTVQPVVERLYHHKGEKE